MSRSKLSTVPMMRWKIWSSTTPGAHHLMHQRPRLFVRQRLDGLGETGRDLARDATAVLGIGEPPGGPLGGPYRAQVGRDDVARQEVILHEVAEDAPDVLLAGGHDGGMR